MNMILVLILFAAIAIYFAHLARTRGIELDRETARADSNWQLYSRTARERDHANKRLALAERPWLAPPSWEREL